MSTLTDQPTEVTTMRKIELEMLAAIKSGTRFAKGNTTVEITDVNAEVYLHGNHIATVSGFGIVEVNTSTLLKYPTRTTLSRLRALDVDVYVRKGEVFLNGEPLTY